APLARAQHFPDLRVRELVEEAQPAQQVELLLLVETVVLRAQLLIELRQRRRELHAALEALRRVLLQRRDDDFLELLGDLVAHRVNRLRRGVDDLVQQLAQRVRTERPKARQELVRDGA